MFNVEGLLGHIYLFSSDPLMVAAFIFMHNEEIQQFKIKYHSYVCRLLSE